MAYPDPLVLKNAAATSVNFTRRNSIPNGWNYTSTTATPSLSDSVNSRFTVTPRKGNTDGNNRSIVTFARKRVDADGFDHTASLSLSLVRSHDADITDADIADLYAYMAEFLIAASGDYKLRFNRGEV